MQNEVGKTAEAGWQVGVSKTIPHPISVVWDFLVSREAVEIWLGPGTELPKERGESYETASGITGQVRSFRPQDRVRLTWRPKDWNHDSTLQITVSVSGSKTALRFHQEWLAGAEERAEQKVYWAEVIDRLATVLAER